MRARMAATSSVRSVRGRSSGSHPAQRRLARHSARGWAHISAQWESRRRWIIIVMAAPLGIGDAPSPSAGRCPRCCLPGSGCCPCDAQCCPSSRECCPVAVTTRLPTKRTGRAPKDTAGRHHADRSGGGNPHSSANASVGAAMAARRPGRTEARQAAAKQIAMRPRVQGQSIEKCTGIVSEATRNIDRMPSQAK